MPLQAPTIGASITTYTIVGLPYYNYGIMGPKTPIRIMKAPKLPRDVEPDLGEGLRDVATAIQDTSPEPRKGASNIRALTGRIRL